MPSHRSAGLEILPLLSRSLPSYTQSATYLTAPLLSSPYREHTRTTRAAETFHSHCCKNIKPTSRNSCTWSSGACNWLPVSRHEPLDTTKDAFSVSTVYNCTLSALYSVALCQHSLHLPSVSTEYSRKLSALYTVALYVSTVYSRTLSTVNSCTLLALYTVALCQHCIKLLSLSPLYIVALCQHCIQFTLSALYTVALC